MSISWIFCLLFFFTLVSGSWRDSYNTIDGSPEVILVVETVSVDISQLDSDLTEDDLSSLPYCDLLQSSLRGTTPCRDRPNLFTSIDYDEMTDTFHVITDRGPVVDCYSFPAVQSENNTIGHPDTEGVYVPDFTPVVASFQVDGETITNYQYTQLSGLEDVPLSGLAKSSEDNQMYGPECTVLPEFGFSYPLAVDPSSVSPSGLRRVSIGGETFLVAIEEFGPSILILNETGEVVRAYVPAGSPSSIINHGLYPVSATLPSILLQAQLSRSFSALSYDESTHTFYVFVEASLGMDQTSTFIRVLQLDGSNLPNQLTYTGMYGFLLETAGQFITAGGSTSQLPLISVVAADLIADKSFLTVERQLISHSTSTFVHLDLSNATNLKGAWDQDLRLEEISASNNALLLDNEELNDQYRTNFASLHPPVYLGFTETLFDSRQVRAWEDFSLDGEPVSSLRVISPSVIAVGIDNNWGFTSTSDTFASLYFIRLGAPSTSALTNSAPSVGSAGNALVLSDSSSPDAYSQKKQWASIEQMNSEWNSLSTTFTLELWVYWRGGSQINDFQPLISRANGSFEMAHFILGLDISSSGNIGAASLRGIVGCSTAVGFDLSSGGTTISTDVWHHVAFVVSASSASSAFAQLYLDGESVGTGVWSGDCASGAVPFASNDPNVFLGMFENLGVNAIVDEVRFWSTARTAEQIQNWMHVPLSGMEQGLVAYYQFNDVPNTQMNAYEFQYFRSTGSDNKPRGLIQPVPTDINRFVPSSVVLETSVQILAVDQSLSSPYQNMITLHAMDAEDDPITYSIVELSPNLAALLNSSDADNILFTETNGALNLSSLPVTLSSNQVGVFVSCNDSLCSSLSDDLWFRYSASANGGESSDIVNLEVEPCSELDACGVCNGDNSQCQCACYHGFTSDFMDYTLFSFLLNENIAKIDEILDVLEPMVEPSTTGYLYNRWQAGYQYTDYTRYLESQKAFTLDCLDTFCDSYVPFENEFYSNLGSFYAAPDDFNTCSCDQGPPNTDELPPVYSA